MFEKLRRPNKAKKKGRVKAFFSYIIFGAICLVFVFLSPMSGQIFGEGVVAYVGSKPIRSREFRLIEESLRSQYQQRLNEATEDESQRLQNQIRKQALQQLINMYLISQAAEKSGFRVSDEELQDEIRSYPVFQRNGRFVYSRYLSYLKSQKLSSSRFEDRIRRFKTTKNWRGIFIKSISSNRLEKNKNREKNRYQIKLRFAEIPFSKVTTQELEPLVFKKNLSQINKLLRQNKIRWETSKEISPIDSFALSILKNKDFVEHIISHLPATGLIPKLMIKEDKSYVIEILSFKKTRTNKQNERFAAFSSFFDYEKSARLFERWVDVQKEEFPIKRSLDL